MKPSHTKWMSFPSALHLAPPGVRTVGLERWSLVSFGGLGLLTCSLLGCQPLSSEALSTDHSLEEAIQDHEASPMVGGSCGPASQLSDEFEDACTLAAFQQSGLTHVEVDIDTRTEGHLTLTWQGTAPAYSGWYQDYQGALLSKSVTGDFMAHTRLHVRDAADPTQAPSQQFNSAGLLVEIPPASRATKTGSPTTSAFKRMPWEPKPRPPRTPPRRSI